MKTLALVLALLAPLTALAQGGIGPGPGTVHSTGGGGGYTGPGDVVAGATAWYGLRAYSAAVAATGTQKAVKIRRASDDHLCDVLIATSGLLGNTANCGTGGDNGQSVAAFSVVHGTFTGSISGTTLTVTGASAGNPGQGDVVTGGTVLSGTLIQGVIVDGSSYTVNFSQTVASASLTFTYANYIPTWYDQSGNVHDVTNATTNQQPQLILGVLGGKPVVSCEPFPGGFMVLNGTVPALSQPFTYSTVVRSTASATSPSFDTDYLTTWDGVTPGILAYFNENTSVTGEPNTGAYASPADDVASAINTWYAIQLGFSGSSSYIALNGTPTTKTFAATGGNQIHICDFDGSGARNFTGMIAETGIWPSLFSSGGAAMSTNQQTYGGF